jgi:uncharacterized membrane protein
MMRFVPMEAAAVSGPYDYWVEIAVSAIEGLAGAVIVIPVIVATARFLVDLLRRREPTAGIFRTYKHSLAGALLLALELLVAADVVNTVVLDFTLVNVCALGVLVLVRTFLSWSLLVEIEGRWPWQRVVGTEKPVEEI